MRRRVWPELQIGMISLLGRPDVRVVISSPDIRADLLRVDNEGRRWLAFHCPDTNTIYVCATVPDDRFLRTVGHEYLHACYRAAGSTPGEFFEVEEQAVRLLEPYFETFLRAVWKPRLPCTRYRSQLRAHAAYVRRRDREIRRGNS